MNFKYQKIMDLFQLKEPSPLPEEEISRIKNCFGEIPKALEEYYRLCGGCEDMNSAQDFLLTTDGRYGDYLLEDFEFPEYYGFYTENQCVSVWAVKKSDLNQENPPVYETYDIFGEDDMPNQSSDIWHKTSDSISEFLIAHAYLHAAFSMPYSNEEFYEANVEEVNQIAEAFPHADADSLLFTGVQFFQPYEDTVIAVLHQEEEYFLVIYSSWNEAHFQEIDKIMSKIFGIEEAE